MLKYKKILIFVAIIGFGAPSVALGGSLVVSLIQGKTPAEAIQIIAEQLDGLFGRVEVLETKQIETNQSMEQSKLEIERIKIKLDCDLLARKIPDKRGYDNWGYTPDIVSLYARATTLLNSSNPNWDSEVNKKLIKEVFEEIKPLYQNYLAKCQ